VPQWFSTIAAS